MSKSLTTAACLLFGLTIVRASVIQQSTDLGSPAHLITFSEVSLAPGTTVTNQFAAFGVTFDGLTYQVGSCNNFANMSGDCLALGNDYDNPPYNNDITHPFSISFNDPQILAGFALITQQGYSTISLLLGDVVQESDTFATSFEGSNDYYVASGRRFDQIQISVNSWFDGATIDNVEFGDPSASSSTSEPSTLGFLVLGLIGIGIGGRKPAFDPRAVIRFRV